MKWNEIFRTRKLLKRLISMSLCIGMAGGQLLSGIPIQAEEQTDQAAYNLPNDPVINPNITIQHYYNFPAMVLGNVEDYYNTLKVNGNGNDNPYYSEENKEDLKKYLAGEDPYKEKFLTVWNTALRNGELPSNTDLNASYKTLREKDPKSTIQLENSDLGTIKTQKILYKMFADETVHYLEKPQMRYMNKLYNGTSADHYNANYTLSEVWLKKVNTDNEKEKNSIDPDSFVRIKAPRLATDSSRHDPSKFIFTNNDQNANIQGGTTEKDIRYHIKGNAENPEQVTVLVTDGMVIRLVFEATEGDLKYEDVNFFDYDITDGKVYATQNDAWTRSKDIDEGKEKGAQRELNSANTYYVNTRKQGINLNSDPFAFGNSNGAAGTTMGDKLWKNSETLNRSNANNRFRPTQWGTSYNGTNLQGATFGLVSGVNQDGSLSWSEGVGAPSLFSTTELEGKTIYEGLSESDPNNKTQENYSLQFNRIGGTYTLSGVNRDDLENSAVLKGLDTLPPIKHAYTDGKNATIHSNEFWPMDYASSYGTVGHDIQFGDSRLANQRKYVSSSNNSVNLPESDGGKDHNAYFGMTTTIPFTLEKGYCAPLRYFFYGDDDMFVFLNKLDENGNVINSKQIADLGGVHSSVGTLVDLWDFIDTDDKKPIESRLDVNGKEETVYEYTGPVHEKKDGTTPANYQLAIYYLERGASGSSCYMRFSVPFEGLSMEETAMNGQIQVEKEVRYSLQNEESSPENQDHYVYQLTLQNPEGEDLNNQYEILIYNLDENGNRKEEVSRGYIAPNGTFRITNKQQALITGLPRSGPDDNLSTSKHKGYYYEVKELGTYDKIYTNTSYSGSGDDNLKHLKPISPNTSTTFLSGTIEKGLDLEQGKYQEGYAFSSLIKDQNYVRFINAEDPGVIKLKKVVDPQIETDTDFTFNITLTNADTSIKTLPYILNRANPSQGQSDQELGTKTSDEGKAGQFEFKLKKDDELILYNLPVGTKYEIKEAQAKTASEQFEVKEIQFSGKYVPDGETNSKSVVRGIIQASTDNTKPEIGVTFVNEYHKIAEVNIPVHKTVTGKPFTDHESYTFEITSDTKNAPMPEKTQISVAPGNGMATIAAENVYDAKGQFGPIVFDDTMKPGEYTYTVHEIAGKEDNVRYDVNKYHVTVNAVIGDDGTVTAGIESITAIDDAGNPIGDPLKDLTFVNDKVQPVQVNIPVEKIFNGRNVTDQDVFTFRISEEEMSNNPQRLNALLKEKKNTIDVKQGENGELNGNFTLGDFGLEDVGKTYKFLIDEVVGNKPLDQVEYDTHKELIVLTFTLEPAADASQHIVSHLTLSSEENAPEITENNPITFTNTYHAVDKIVIPVQKVLRGRNLTDDDRFVFEISAEANTPMPEQTRLTIAKNDLLENSENIAQKEFIIPLTDEHIKTGDTATYTYTIKELKGNDTNIQYDVATTYKITVEASNTTENGITSTIAVVDENEERQEPAIAKFENTHYEPISASIPIRKVLNGRQPLAGDIFTFQIRGNDDASQAKIKTPSKVDIDLSKEENTSQFNIGEFTLADAEAGKIYEFTIQETQGNLDGMIYDTTERKVTATVSLKAGKLEVELNEVQAQDSAASSKLITNDAPLTFTNTYQPTGTLEIPVTKTLEGRGFTNGDRFLFEITPVTEGAPLPAQTILSVLPTAGTSVESLFGPITYTEENVNKAYSYTVKEISTGLSGMQYDEAKYEVKVNVTKNDKGEIIPNAIYNNGTTDVEKIEFVNHYDPEVVVKLPVMKTLEGRTMTDSDKFVFDLNGEGSAPMPEHNQVTVQGKGGHTGETTFDPIVFKNEGTYKYRITEHQGSIEHIQYSKVEYTVTVNIAKHPVSGALTSSYSMVSSAAPDVTSDTAAFVNVYQPSGTWRPSVTKELLGAELKDQAYSFEMTVKDNAGTVIYQKKAQNSADGSVDFPLVQFNTVGNYTAVIKEEALPAGSSVQYDTHTIEYTLNVEDHDGELVVTQNPPEPFVFTNDAGLRISKQLIPGSGQTLDENDLNYDFPFEVQFSENMASKTLHAKRNGEEETLTVGADAKVNFKLKHDDTLIIYDIPKNTAYSVSENSGSKWVDKYLQIDTIGDSNGIFSNGVEASVTFRNLKPSTDDVVISGFKTMDPNGDPYPMQAGLYSFKISADGQSTTSRIMDKESEFVPEEEPLDESFEIHRSSLPELDINGDEEDPVDSQTEEPEIPAPADSKQKRKLTMLRREAETKAVPEDTPLPDDPIAKNNEFGRFEFGKIVFTTPGIYTYRIEELPSTIPGMKHDTRIYKAEITVVEDKGSVEVQRIRYMDMNNNILDNNRIVFMNTYSETQKPKLEIHKEQSRNFEPFTRETQTVNAGDLVTYRLTVTNTGDALAKNVMIHDTVPVPEGDGDAQLTLLKSSLINNVTLDGNKITWSIGDLAPGTSYSVSFQVQVPKVKSATSWKNIATTTTDSPLDEKPDPSEEVTIESEPAKPDVTIHKYESTTQSERYDKTKPLEVKSGELVTYDMIVTNSGNEDATNVVVTDKVPDGLEFVQAFDGGSYENRAITWNVGTLKANGGTAIVSFQIRIPVVEKDEEWSNIASLKYDGEKPKNSNEVKINTIVKNLEIEKLQAVNHGPLTKDRQAVKAGDVVTYALHITNPGDHTIDNASVRDIVPDGLELILSSIKGGNYNPETHEITWNLGKIDAKDEKQVTFSVKVPKVDQKTSWKNISTLIYDEEKPKDSNEVEVGTDLPNLTIVKDQKLETDPDYTFEKRTGQTGDKLTYRLTVTNTGTATAKDVVIEDTIPTAELMETPLFLRFVSASDNGELNDRTQTITWSIGDVAPGQSRSVTFTVTIPGVKQNTLWINKAYTHYENNPDNPDEGEPKDIPSNEVKVDTMVPAVILEKEHKLNEGDRVTSLLHGNAHDTVTYYLKAANTSMATAHDVWIKDTIPTHENGTLVLKEIDETYAHELKEETGEIVWKIGDLAPGEEKEVWFSVTVPEVQEATRWRNIASVSHQEDPTVPREEIETPPVEVEVLVPELEIVKRQAKNDGSLTQGLIQANAGDTITYAIEVSNTGTGPAQNIVVEDIIPEGLELVNGSISDQGQNRGGKITWNMASLEAGKTKTFTFKVKIPSVKEYTRWANVATVSDEDDPDPKPTPPVEVETEAPHLTVEKSQKRNEGNRTKDKLSVVGKDRVTYFIKVTNDGQADAKDVVVSDVVPEGLILVDGSVSDSGLVEKGVISWQLGTLAAGASRTVSFAVDVPESEGVWKNIAEAIESTHPEEPTPSNEVEIETPKEEPNITIEKLQAQNDAQPSKTRIKARVDDTITYVLRVQNRGKETVRDIVVKDAIPQGLRFVSGSISKEGTIENGVVSWKIEELAPDQIVDLTFQVKVPVVTRNSAWINVGVLIHDDKQTPSNEVTVSIEPETPASSKNGKPTSPNTAAETNHMIWLGALMISVLVLAVLWKRKKNISH